MKEKDNEGEGDGEERPHLQGREVSRVLREEAGMVLPARVLAQDMTVFSGSAVFGGGCAREKVMCEEF